MTEPELLDIRQAAADTGRSAETVRRWIWSGKLAATKRGNRLLIDRTELERFLPDRPDTSPPGLAGWAAELEQAAVGGRSAADLVLERRAREPGGR
jgi:excisionase family DNA binding protein